jgi:hypothetical protein
MQPAAGRSDASHRVMKTRPLQSTLALTRSRPLTRPFGLPVYVAASQLAPFGKRSIKSSAKLEALKLAVSMMDLTISNVALFWSRVSLFSRLTTASLVFGHSWMKNFLRGGAILAIACRAVAFCVGGSIFGLIAPEPHSFAKATLLPSQQKGRVLTFADRVAYQYAIEEIYWRHRIWPKENPGPKPSLDQVMSRAEIERKVEDYLGNSQMLEHYWQRSITSDQLQAEMDRMASHTKQPDVLRELFAALNNDPFVIAECLARPSSPPRTYMGDGFTNT